MAIKKQKRKERQSGMQIIHQNFSANLRGLILYVTNIEPITSKSDKDKLEHLHNVMTRILRVAGYSSEKSLQSKHKSVPKKFARLNSTRVKKLITELRGVPEITKLQTHLLYAGSFILLICYLDFLISDLLRIYYQFFPQSLSKKEQTISLDELRTCRDVREAVDLVISKEIEKVLYSGFDHKLKYLEKLNIVNGMDLVQLEVIREAIERRNLLVHNNSRISKRYLEAVSKSFYSAQKKKPKEGQVVIVSSSYFKKVFKEFSIAGIILIQNCWRKWRKGEIDVADGALNDTMYKALQNEEWEFAERIGLFANKLTMHDAAVQLAVKVNYCQALKWQGKNNQLQEELLKFDTSTLSAEYLAAIAALKSDRDGFYGNLRQAISSGKIDKVDLMEWPLFREFRRDSNYTRRVAAAFAHVSRSKARKKKR